MSHVCRCVVLRKHCTLHKQYVGLLVRETSALEFSMHMLLQRKDPCRPTVKPKPRLHSNVIFCNVRSKHFYNIPSCQQHLEHVLSLLAWWETVLTRKQHLLFIRMPYKHYVYVYLAMGYSVHIYCDCCLSETGEAVGYRTTKM